MGLSDEELAEELAAVKIIKVQATVTFETYATTDLAPLNGDSVEARIADQIADAVGHRAHTGAEWEPGDVLVVPVGHPEFAIDVRNVAFSETKLPVDVEHVVELSRALTESI